MKAGGCTPRPRKLSPASTVTTTGTSMAARMRSGPTKLGMTWRQRIMGAPAPSERTRSSFPVLATPVTSAPSALASWTAQILNSGCFEPGS